MRSETYRMLTRILAVSIVGLAVLLAGCQKSSEAEVETASGEVNELPAELLADSESAGMLDDTNELALGIMKLDGTEQALSAEQASAMLPLWKALQSGTFQGTAETDAVVGQIRGMLTEAQQSAIDALDLGMDDMRTWMEEQGIGTPAMGEFVERTEPKGQRPEGATPPEGMPEGTGSQGNGPQFFGNMTEEERAEMREKLDSMTEEERRQYMEQQGLTFQGGGPGGGQQGQQTFGMFALNIYEPLIAYLTELAAQ